MANRSLVFALIIVAVVNATQIMRRPPDYKTLLKPYAHVPPRNVTMRAIPEPLMRERAIVESPMSKRAGGKLSVGYFTNWFVGSL